MRQVEAVFQTIFSSSTDQGIVSSYLHMLNRQIYAELRHDEDHPSLVPVAQILKGYQMNTHQVRKFVKYLRAHDIPVGYNPAYCVPVSFLQQAREVLQSHPDILKNPYVNIAWGPEPQQMPTLSDITREGTYTGIKNAFSVVGVRRTKNFLTYVGNDCPVTIYKVARREGYYIARKDELEFIAYLRSRQVTK